MRLIAYRATAHVAAPGTGFLAALFDEIAKALHVALNAPLDDAQCRRLFDLSATVQGTCAVAGDVAGALGKVIASRQRELLEELTTRNGRWFDLEMDKLDRWAEDRRSSLKATLDELDNRIREARRAARFTLMPTR